MFLAWVQNDLVHCKPLVFEQLTWYTRAFFHISDSQSGFRGTLWFHR